MNYKIILISIASIVFLTTCNKDYPNPDTNDCQDVIWAEGVYNDASSIMDEAAATGKLPLYCDVQTPQDLSACASIKYQNLNLLDADTLIVDFGPSDCLCADNRYRRGKILAILTSAYYDSTNTSGVIIAFNGYYVNDNKVEGTKTVIVKGRNVTTSNYEFTSTVAGKITNRLAQTMTWNATETKVVLNQTSYSSWYGATYSITGTASGSGFNGTNYSSSITTALGLTGGCNYIESGIISVTPSGLTPRILNFGSGACDRFIDVTLDGNHYNINQQ